MVVPSNWTNGCASADTLRRSAPPRRAARAPLLAGTADLTREARRAIVVATPPDDVPTLTQALGPRLSRTCEFWFRRGLGTSVDFARLGPFHAVDSVRVAQIGWCTRISAGLGLEVRGGERFFDCLYRRGLGRAAANEAEAALRDGWCVGFAVFDPRDAKPVVSTVDYFFGASAILALLPSA